MALRAKGTSKAKLAGEASAELGDEALNHQAELGGEASAELGGEASAELAGEASYSQIPRWGGGSIRFGLSNSDDASGSHAESQAQIDIEAEEIRAARSRRLRR